MGCMEGDRDSIGNEGAEPSDPLVPATDAPPGTRPRLEHQVVDLGAAFVLALFVWMIVLAVLNRDAGRVVAKIPSRDRVLMTSDEWPSEEQLTACFDPTEGPTRPTQQEKDRLKGDLYHWLGGSPLFFSVSWYRVPPGSITAPTSGEATPPVFRATDPGHNRMIVPFPADAVSPAAPNFTFGVDSVLLARMRGESQRGATVVVQVHDPSDIEFAISERPDGSRVFISDCLIGIDYFHEWADEEVNAGRAADTNAVLDWFIDPTRAFEVQDELNEFTQRRVSRR